MTRQTDIARLLELWLVDDEPDVLSDRVLTTVAGRLPQVRQSSRSLNLFGSWRAAAVAASLAVLAAGSAIGYGLLQPNPPITLPPLPSSTPTSTPFVDATLHPIPSYSIPPVEHPEGSENAPITGRVEASSLDARISLDLDGWNNPPGFMFFATKEAIIQLEGGGLGLWGLIRPQAIPGRSGPALTAVLHRPSGPDPKAILRIQFFDGAGGRLSGEAARIAADAYDGNGRVADFLELSAGRAALIRTQATGDEGEDFEIDIYLIDLGDTEAQVTFGAIGSDHDDLQPEYQRIVRSIRLLN